MVPRTVPAERPISAPIFIPAPALSNMLPVPYPYSSVDAATPYSLLFFFMESMMAVYSLSRFSLAASSIVPPIHCNTALRAVTAIVSPATIAISLPEPSPPVPPPLELVTLQAVPWLLRSIWLTLRYVITVVVAIIANGAIPATTAPTT